MMPDSGKFLLELFLMFSAGKLLAEGCERLAQPGVLGEVLAGVVLGPSVLALVRPDGLTRGMAEIGAIFLLFTVGLETSPRKLLRAGRTATLVALLGVIFPFAVGWLYMRFSAHGLPESMFVGAAMVATSVGITARVLRDGGLLGTRMAEVILGAAVLDDILGLIALAVVSDLSHGSVNYLQLGALAGEAIAFNLIVLLLGPRLVRRVRPAVALLRARNSAFILSVILCLGLSLASIYAGMAAIIGAFLAGLALADPSEEWRLRETTHPISEFTTPFFFVFLGVQMDLRAAVAPAALRTAIVICLLAIASKVVGCGLGSSGLGWKTALEVGVGMAPRGEVGLIIAAAGLGLHAISPAIYGVVLIMSVVTTLVTPPALRLLLRRS